MNGLMATIRNFKLTIRASNAMFTAARISVKKMKTLQKYKLNKELFRLGIGTNDVEIGGRKDETSNTLE